MSGTQRLKKAVVDALPDPVAERVLPWRRAAFVAAGLSRTAGPASRRLLIGPVNSAGQAYAWARAAERLPDVAAANFMYRGGEDVFAYPADHSVPTPYFVSNHRWQHAQRRAIARNFTHVLIESGRRILGAGDDVREDIAFLSGRGMKVGLLWHGSDIRTPSAHATMVDDSPFRDQKYVDQSRLEQLSLRNHALTTDAGLPSFVSTPDLLEFVPEATWLPVVVDSERWEKAAGRSVLRRERPVVVHAPSRAGLKGTALISATLGRLHDERLIDYREIAGIPAAEMPQVYGEADIVLDQFSLGIYGVAACEALAGGRIVVSHVSDQVRNTVRMATGRELPVIEAKAAELERVLRDIIAEPDHALRIAEQGPAFVHDVHDGTRSREALMSFLDLPGATDVHGRLEGCAVK